MAVERRAKGHGEPSVRFDPCHFAVLPVRALVSLDHEWKICHVLEFI